MEPINLTSAEWHIMECLWEAAPQTGRELSEKNGSPHGLEPQYHADTFAAPGGQGHRALRLGGDKKCLFPRCTEGGCGPAGNAEPFGPGLSGKTEHAGKHHDAKEGRLQRGAR